MNAITILYIYRNRDAERVRRSLDSLQAQTDTDFTVLFVDYGSDPAFRDVVEPLVKRYPFCKYLYNDTRGMPWNRAHALNTGLRRCDTGFAFTADIDLVFRHDFVATLKRAAAADRVTFFRVYYLPAKFRDWDRLDGRTFPKSEDFALGLALLPLPVIRRLQGYDEFYCYWGLEDNDLKQRFETAGVPTSFYDDDVLLYHQYHPPTIASEASFPAGWGEFQRAYFHDMSAVAVRNGPDAWGVLCGTGDRPAWALLNDAGTPFETTDTTARYLQFKVARALQDAAPGQPVAMAFTDTRSAAYERSNLGRLARWIRRCFVLLRIPVTVQTRYRHLYQTVYEARDLLVLFVVSNRGRIADYAFVVRDNTLRFVLIKA